VTGARRPLRTGGPGWALAGACARCGHSGDRCRCPPPVPPAASTGKPTIRLRMEKRCGKPVTVLAAEGLSPADLEALVGELKGLCGTGGTVKRGQAELQGEHRARLRPLLAGRGYRVKG
jgi:translation initiation factor 1